jgi:hypothetical protein
MPVLFWYQTWFGRKLGDAEIGRYLQDTEHPRKIQHALAQAADGIVRGDPAIRRWYPQIAAAARHPLPLVRSTAAWTMGQDGNSEIFHRALLELLKDPDLMVRRNAALALVRFQDASGRAELVAMLLPYGVPAPAGGIVSIRIHEGQTAGSGALLARIRPQQGGDVEVRAPFAAKVNRVLRAQGAQVAKGDRLIALNPDSDQAWEALRGLYLVGQPEDLADVERYGRAAESIPERVRQQAVLTAAAIRTRAERDPSR